MTMFTQSHNPSNFNGFSQHRSYTNFDIKIDGFTRIFAGLLTNYEVKQQILI